MLPLTAVPLRIRELTGKAPPGIITLRRLAGSAALPVSRIRNRWYVAEGDVVAVAAIGWAAEQSVKSRARRDAWAASKAA